jgi:hypothetical protein
MAPRGQGSAVTVMPPSDSEILPSSDVDIEASDGDVQIKETRKARLLPLLLIALSAALLSYPVESTNVVCVRMWRDWARVSSSFPCRCIVAEGKKVLQSFRFSREAHHTCPLIALDLYLRARGKVDEPVAGNTCAGILITGKDLENPYINRFHLEELPVLR